MLAYTQMMHCTKLVSASNFVNFSNGDSLVSVVTATLQFHQQSFSHAVT